MYTSIWWYLRVLPVLHRPEVVDIGVNTIYKNMPYAEMTIELDHFQVFSMCMAIYVSI